MKDQDNAHVAGGKVDSTAPDTKHTATLDRYATENAARRVREYFYPRPHETSDTGKKAAFDRAKKQTLEVIQRALVEVGSLTFEQYLATDKRGMSDWPFWNPQEEKEAAAAPNAHDDLVKALKKALRALEIAGPLSSIGMDAHNVGTAALAKAGAQ